MMVEAVELFVAAAGQRPRIGALRHFLVHAAHGYPRANNNETVIEVPKIQRAWDLA